MFSVGPCKEQVSNAADVCTFYISLFCCLIYKKYISKFRLVQKHLVFFSKPETATQLMVAITDLRSSAP
jgi:hypothetical protein